MYGSENFDNFKNYEAFLKTNLKFNNEEDRKKYFQDENKTICLQ